MNDYEQMYYDALYKIKKLEREIKLLEDEKEIYKSLIGNNSLKQIIATDLIKYLRKECKNGYRKKDCRNKKIIRK